MPYLCTVVTGDNPYGPHLDLLEFSVTGDFDAAAWTNGRTSPHTMTFNISPSAAWRDGASGPALTKLAGFRKH